MSILIAGLALLGSLAADGPRLSPTMPPSEPVDYQTQQLEDQFQKVAEAMLALETLEGPSQEQTQIQEPCND